MKMIEQLEQLRIATQLAKQLGRVAFVPTMGNLHDGHLTLMREARKHAQTVICSIFVNPMQFGANEDLDKYPRTLDADIAALESAGVDLLYFPSFDTMYPKPLSDQTKVEVPVISDLYCGASRSGHFVGVATVVAKLFNMVQPDVALFGTKDFQQLAVIRRMVADLAMPIEIIGVPTVRDADGLAMSSRNQYLTTEQRAIAPMIYAELKQLAETLSQDLSQLEQQSADSQRRLAEAGFEPDYLHVLDAETLLPLTNQSQQGVILIAAKLGAARLIDNIEFTCAL
ncbi:MAG: pantoate--beta-alanine ligase [Sedimenticolaceae bacterium]